MTTTAHEAAMDRLIDRLDSLHSAPYVACQVLTLLQDEDFDTTELVQCLEADPALATSVLRLVNSSYFGLARNVASLTHAVTFLGSRSLRLAVLSFGLLDRMIADAPGQVYQDFWRRSLTMGAAGARLATFKDTVPCDEAYVAGLLADVGLLLLAQLETGSYVKLFDKVGHTPLLVECERERYGFHHGQIGARLLDRWNLPETLIEAVAEHHSVPSAGDDLQLITHVSDLLADALWTPESPSVHDARRLLESGFGLDLDGFITLAVECREIIRENAEMYNVDLAGEIDCEALLAQARHKYMEEAMEAAVDWDSLASVAEQEHVIDFRTEIR